MTINGRIPIAGLLTCMWFGGFYAVHAVAQTPCGTDGYRTVTRSWDRLLDRGWEWRQECAHPERPLRLVAMSAAESDVVGSGSPAIANQAEDGPALLQQPLMVQAGDAVRVWMKDEMVRIEMTGVVERSAHRGERVVVQIARQDDETGLTVQRLSGTVSGPDEVEMER